MGPARRIDMIHVVFPKRVEGVFGNRSLGTRTYTRTGPQQEFAEWFEALDRWVGATLSMSEAAIFVGVSRVTVLERIQKGGLSLFKYDFDEGSTSGKRIIRSGQVTRIPLPECQIWKYFREGDVARVAEIAADMDEQGERVGLDDWEERYSPAVERYEEDKERRIEEAIAAHEAEVSYMVETAIEADEQIRQEIAEQRENAAGKARVKHEHDKG